MLINIKWILSQLLFYGFHIISTLGETYWGYKIYDINAKDSFEKELLFRLSSNENYDFFHLPKLMGKPARVMIQPNDQIDFETMLSRFGVEYNIINDNLGRSLEIDRMKNNFLRSITPISQTVQNSRMNFNDFQRIDTINNYLDELAKDFSTRVKVRTLGKSYEKRPLKVITITNGDGIDNKNVILIDAGIHAREWIAHSSVLYIIHQLVENFNENIDLLKTYDWIIMPVVNPDGYEYTHTTSRMWRKTRRPIDDICFGTDGNRNFDFHWGEIGASSMSCSETFRGEKAFSEPETQTLRNLMLSLNGRGKMYLTLHSFGNYLLYPWGWTDELPETWKDIDEIAKTGAKAIRQATGTNYEIGSSTNVLYAAAGGSDDYAFAVAKIPIAITMELPPGGSGFDPIPQQILPLVKETWIGVKAMAKMVIERY